MHISSSAAVYVISVAADLAGMHPQTLRQYDRLGLVTPERTAGRGRRYSGKDIAKLRLIQQLSQDEGVNLVGIKKIIDLQNEVDALKSRNEELEAEVRSRMSAQEREARVALGASPSPVRWSSTTGSGGAERAGQLSAGRPAQRWQASSALAGQLSAGRPAQRWQARSERRWIAAVVTRMPICVGTRPRW